jgi:hypothetical protein
MAPTLYRQAQETGTLPDIRLCNFGLISPARIGLSRRLQERSTNSATKPCFTASGEVLQIHVVVRVEPVAEVAALRFQSREVLAGINIIVGEPLPKRGDHKLLVIELVIRVTFRAAEVPTVLVQFRQCLRNNFVLRQSEIPI